MSNPCTSIIHECPKCGYLSNIKRDIFRHSGHCDRMIPMKPKFEHLPKRNKNALICFGRKLLFLEY